MKYYITIASILAVLVLTFSINKHCSSSNKKSNNRLLKTINIEDFYFKDYLNNFDYICSHESKDGKNIKSLTRYRYSTSDNKYMQYETILFNKNGRPVMALWPNEFNKNIFSKTYYYYDNNGNRYLEISISDNHYDTIYTYRKFDEYNRKCAEIAYNTKRKEYNFLFFIKIKPISDSELKIKYEDFSTYGSEENILPFETRDITVKILNETEVEAFTQRIIHGDSQYNSSSKKLYIIDNNALVLDSKEARKSKEEDINWTERKSDNTQIKRRFKYYEAKEKEVEQNFPIDQSVITFLEKKLKTLPDLAWEHHKKSKKGLAERKSILKKGKNLSKIELTEAATIESFTPQLWYIVSQSSGHINGIENECTVVGYNTPLKNEDDFNRRCLAIYEQSNGRYILHKQSFGALEDFIDDDNDLLFDGFNEANFSVNIENGDINIEYAYMRGEAYYTFSYDKEEWVLSSYSSNHRTCCETEATSYNYKTKEYSYSFMNNSGEDTSKDTSVTNIQERPIIYMDKMNVRQFDYDETGLLAK